ncbi:MAG: hypothetical protein MJ172_11690 [Clostridia bacterium]|nr:hypothetical protein [Clostridia bacterium]
MRKLFKKLVPIIFILFWLAVTETAYISEDTSSLEIGLTAVIFAPALIIGVVLLILSFRNRKSSKVKKAEAMMNSHGEILTRYKMAHDSNDNEEFLTGFREQYADFFVSNLPENHPIQKCVTQIYFNALQLHRNKLNKMGLTMHFKSERKEYGKTPVREKKLFDMKYDVKDIDEDIAAKTIFMKDGKEIHTKTDSQTSHITILKAHVPGPNRVICPNCGMELDKNDLLDGCDYCGTKFMIEDLDSSVSGFSLRTNFEVQAQKYQSALDRFTTFVIYAIFTVCVIFSAVLTFIASKMVFEDQNVGVFMIAFATLLTACITSGILSSILVPVSCAVLFPVVGVGRLALDVSRATYLRMKEAQKKDIENENKVKAHDNLFSISNFYSGVQNKLATVIYADNVDQANAFAANDADLSEAYNKFKDVIYMDITDIDLVKYTVDSNYQLAQVDAELKLLSYDSNKIKPYTQKVRLGLRKDVACKTQSICAPSVMMCQGCGLSRSLLDGKRCPNCGGLIDFEKFDWVINKLEVK